MVDPKVIIARYPVGARFGSMGASHSGLAKLNFPVQCLTECCDEWSLFLWYKRENFHFSLDSDVWGELFFERAPLPFWDRSLSLNKRSQRKALLLRIFFDFASATLDAVVFGFRMLPMILLPPLLCGDILYSNALGSSSPSILIFNFTFQMTLLVK